MWVYKYMSEAMGSWEVGFYVGVHFHTIEIFINKTDARAAVHFLNGGN